MSDTYLEKSLIEKEMKEIISHEMNALFERSPFTREFHLGKITDFDYYRRHVLETALRIRLNNEVDAFCLYKLGHSNNTLAKKLARYLNEEYGHENMFFTDVSNLGMSKEAALQTEPFFATKLLIGFLYLSVEKDGGIPTMVWNWFVEWYSGRYNEAITRKAEETFGVDKVRGSKAHLQYDQNEQHEDLMFSTVLECVKSTQDVEKAKRYASQFVRLVGMYFDELHELTVAKKF